MTKNISIIKRLYKDYTIKFIKNEYKKIFKVNNFNIFLSMSDEKKYSIASVIISK